MHAQRNRFCGQPARIARRSATLALLVVAFGLAGCGNHWRPSERAVYAAACDAIRLAPEQGAGLQPGPIESCTFYIAKNAARIDVPVEGTPGYTVWLNRVARTWTVHAAYRSDATPPAGQVPDRPAG